MIIYKTTNLINNKIYIGKDKHNNPKYLGSGLNLNKAIKKYGRENFTKEILEICENEDILNEREKYWIYFFNSTKREIGYNLTDGGTGGNTLKYHKDKDKILAKMREASKKAQQTEQYKLKRSLNLKNRWKNPEYRAKMISYLKQRKITWKDKIRESVKKDYLINGTRKHTPEMRQKLSLIQKGKDIIKIDIEIELFIVDLYKENYQIKIISKQLNISNYIVIRVLKKHNVYIKYKTGVRKNELKQPPTSKR